MGDGVKNKISYPFSGTGVLHITLQALYKAMVGGIIHGLKIPVSGLIVSSCSVICICLIARYVIVRGASIKATVIVTIFKMVLSPQAPPPGYIAESGLQQIMILTIVHGQAFVAGININFLNGRKYKLNSLGG